MGFSEERSSVSSVLQIPPPSPLHAAQVTTALFFIILWDIYTPMCTYVILSVTSGCNLHGTAVSIGVPVDSYFNYLGLQV